MGAGRRSKTGIEEHPGSAKEEKASLAAFEEGTPGHRGRESRWEWEPSGALEVHAGSGEAGAGKEMDLSLPQDFLSGFSTLSNLWVCSVFLRTRRVYLGEGGWCPSVLCTPPPSPTPAHPGICHVSRRRSPCCFFSPPVLPSCPSPNLSSYLTLIRTHGFGPENQGGS